jgi:sulfite reductase (NADPH) hemoprotein beta-component
MYLYDPIDQRLVDERVAQYRDQTRRFLAGRLSDADFLPLRLQNGLYLQRHAPMLRVAIPYGLLTSRQLQRLAHIARTYDRGYGHFSTRQNLQFNWPKLEQVPDILAELADVQMHAIQTSGNCIRNITTDHFAAVAPDEIVDPLVWAELLRQWSTLHPEFAFLPRKFKIAISGARDDRAATLVHDIGLQARHDDSGAIGFRVIVGGGLGRTPMVGHAIREFIAWPHLLTYLEAILRVYNRYGRRDNKYKARIKILVKDRTPQGFAAEVDEEWRHLAGGPGTLEQAELDRVAARFTRPAYRPLPATSAYIDTMRQADPAFRRWHERNVHPHRVSGYAAVTLSLKRPAMAPGDATADQMDAIAGLAQRFSFGELRVTHEQNLVFADVERDRLYELWQALRPLGLASANVGLIGNVISCPGGDFCALANAVSIPVAQAIQHRFENLDYQYDIGELDLNISGCINACGHHHIGHIGILGVDKAGEEWYQVTIGGRQGASAAIGRIIGPAISREAVPDAVESLIRVYLSGRESETERFVDFVHRVGLDPFREAVYAHAD